MKKFECLNDGITAIPFMNQELRKTIHYSIMFLSKAKFEARKDKDTKSKMHFL